MKLRTKILLINFGVVLVLTILTALSEGINNDFAFFFGLILSIIGSLALFISLILFLTQSREAAKGFLLSAGVMLLLGFTVCSAAFA